MFTWRNTFDFSQTSAVYETKIFPAGESEKCRWVLITLVSSGSFFFPFYSTQIKKKKRFLRPGSSPDVFSLSLTSCDLDTRAQSCPEKSSNQSNTLLPVWWMKHQTSSHLIILPSRVFFSGPCLWHGTRDGPSFWSRFKYVNNVKCFTDTHSLQRMNPNYFDEMLGFFLLRHHVVALLVVI